MILLLFLNGYRSKKNLEVVTFTADIGQGIEVKDAKKKAKNLGVREIFVEDLTNEFVGPVFPMFEQMLFMKVNIYLAHQLPDL